MASNSANLFASSAGQKSEIDFIEFKSSYWWMCLPSVGPEQKLVSFLLYLLKAAHILWLWSPISDWKPAVQHFKFLS